MKLSFALIIFFFSGQLYASQLTFQGVTLLQPNAVFEEKQIDVKELSSYIKEIQGLLIQKVNEMEFPQKSGYFVIAVKERNKAKLWLDFKSEISAKQSQVLEDVVSNRKAFNVSNGTIIFALNASIDGSNDSLTSPLPEEWRIFIKSQNKQMDIELLVNTIWPNETLGN